MYKTIVDRIDYKPISCLIELCFKCNLNCKHCGSSLNAFKDNRKGEPLRLEEFYSIIDELKKLGGKRIGLVGGEPLMYEHWEEVARYASKKDFYISMISNGMLIDAQMAKRIKNAGIKLVALSLDGPESYHNSLRGNNKAYGNVMRAISSLVNEHIQVNIITTIMKDNLSLLPEIENILSDKGISYWQLQIGVPMGKLEDHKEFVIEPKQLPEIEKFILGAKQRKLVEITVTDSIGYCSKNELELRNNNSTLGHRVFVGCMAGMLSIGIESNGNVKGCLSLQNPCFIEGNLREKSLTQIWKSEESFSYNRKFSPNNLGGDCKKCQYGNICRGGCTTLAYNTSGQVNTNQYCLHMIEERIGDGD